MERIFTPLIEEIIDCFENDEQVIGKWEILHGQAEAQSETLPQKNIYFLPGGEQYWCFGWTKGYWLRKYNSTACAYEIKEFAGREYLIIEWKSGDYRFGGLPTDHYVMVRA